MTGYPYLITCLILLLISSKLWTLFPRQRRAMMISGFVSMPSSLTTYFFVPDYWRPVRLFDLSLGIEDILFSFATGVIVWAFAVWGQGGIRTILSVKTVLQRYGKILVLGIPVLLLVRQIPVNVMTQAFAGICIIGAILHLNRRFAFFHAIKTALAFCAVYSVLLAAVFSAFPEFVSQWNHDGLSGILIWGFPMEESLWALCYGGCWTYVMMFILSAEPDPA